VEVWRGGAGSPAERDLQRERARHRRNSRRPGPTC